MRAKSVFVNDRLVGEAETWASVYKLLAKKGLALLGTPRTTEGPFAFYLHGEVANVVQSESGTGIEIVRDAPASENIVEGDLTQLVEKLQGLDGQNLNQFVSDLHTAFSEVASEIDPRLSAISAPIPSPSDGIQHAAEQRRIDSTDPVVAAAFISTAALSLPDVGEQATERPTIDDTPALISTHGTRRSPATAGSRWVKRAGLLLTLCAVIASVPWVLPVLNSDLARTKTLDPESVIKLDALEPSYGDPSPKENIASMEGTTTPAAQFARVPDDQAKKEIVPVEVTTVPRAQAARPLRAGTAIEALLDRADQFLRQGDIITARSFYERASALGSARAATGVARTFDPAFLSRLRVVGVRGDPERAAIWYRKANKASDLATSDGASPQSEK